jgi:shikimate 5-dehydrogenase
MLVQQGAYAFKKWTGQVPPVDVMRQACLSKLSIPDQQISD